MGKIKDIITKILHLNGVTHKTLPFLLTVSIALVVGYIKSMNFNMTNFYERAIGHASINGADAPMRVIAFWMCLLIFALSFLLGSYITDRINGYLAKKYSVDAFKTEKTLFFEFGILLFINELIFLYGFVKNTSSRAPWLLFLVFSFAALCVHSLISLLMARKKLGNETPLQSALAFTLPIPLSYFALLVLSSGAPTVLIISVKAAAVYFGFYLVARFLLYRKLRPIAAGYALIPLSFLPLLYVVANEAQYTLTKHGIVISPKVIALGLNIFLIGIAALVYRLKRHADNDELAMKKIVDIVLPALLVTAGVFSAHYQEISPNFDLLHNGNTTLPTQQFLQFGNIPLLDVWSHQNFPILTFLYGALNGLNLLEHNIWANMSRTVVNILICYYVLRQFIGVRWAALLILFTPIVAFANTYYIAGLLPLLYLKRMRDKRGAFDYGVFFALGLLAFVYQSSSGMIAVVSALVMTALSCSSKKNVCDAAKGVVITALVPSIIYFTYVFLRGESISDRLALIAALGRQDILICAYANLIGANRTPFEILTYLGVFPALGIVSAYLALRPKEKTFVNYGIVYISVATIICSLRALARHSLVEGLPTDYYPLLFVLVPFVTLKGKTLRKAASSLVIAIFLLTPYVNTGYGIAANGIKDFTFRQFDIGDIRCDTFNAPAYPSNLRKVLDTVLTDEQTFFETINGYLLYALMERECTFLPVSTLMIQYERPQIAYIHTLEKLYEKNKVPIIITGKSDWWGAAIDGIPSELSVFKLEEWIYAHYKPWIWVDGFHLWKANNSEIEISDNTKKLADIPFSPDSIGLVNDLASEIIDGALLLNSGERDPFISLPLTEPFNPLSQENTILKILYKTSVSGPLQVFYNFAGYNETDSARTDTTATGSYQTAYISIPKPETPALIKSIRVDPPNNAVFEIKSLEFVKLPFIYQEQDFIQQDFNMIMLPYVWGNFDKKVNKRFPEEQQRIADNLPIEADTPAILALNTSIDKRNGNYVYFRINAEESGSLTLKYGNDIINSCSFNITAGVYNYLVRISSQYNWVNEPQSRLEVITDAPVMIERVSVLKGD